MAFTLLKWVGLVSACGICCVGFSQEKAKSATSASSSATATTAHESNKLEEVPRVPGIRTALRNLNVGVSFTGVHDSALGWYTVVTPAVSYAFTQHYSADASVSIYPYRLVEDQNPGDPDQSRSKQNIAEVSDTLLGFHATFDRHFVQNTFTAILTAPSGDSSVGLGTGQITFDLSDHLDRIYRRVNWMLDLGGGNSAGLFNTLVSKDYTSLGSLVHFQAGAAFWPIDSAYVQFSAYEALPLGSQTIYTMPSAPGGPASQSVTRTSASEDNGLTASTTIPLNAHFLLSGYYNRSLRHGRDTASMGVTYVLRGSARQKQLSTVDRALREAEGANP